MSLLLGMSLPIVVGGVIFLGGLGYAIAGAVSSRRPGEDPEETLEEAGDRFAAYTGGILTTARVIVATGAMVVTMALSEAGGLIGELFGGMPLVGSNVLGLAALLAEFGDVSPLPGSVTLTLAMGAFAVALAAKFDIVEG